jgi:hypothetical protein
MPAGLGNSAGAGLRPAAPRRACGASLTCPGRQARIGARDQWLGLTMLRLLTLVVGVLAYSAVVLAVATFIILGNVIGDCFDNQPCRQHQRAFAEMLPWGLAVSFCLNNLFVAWLFRRRSDRTQL